MNLFEFFFVQLYLKTRLKIRFRTQGDGGDVPRAKSQLFNKYFTLFMKLLPPSGGGVGELRRHVIAAMCNLLSANIESGMGHVMSESGGGFTSP